MPDQQPAIRPDLLTRRQALVGGLALVGAAGALAACSSNPSSEGGTSSAIASTAPDPTVLDEQQLIDRYEATIAAFPALAATLTPIRDQHAEHLTALGGAPAAAPSPAVTAGAGLSAAQTSKAAVGALIDAERTAMRERLAACVAATTPERARVLAYVAASEGSHIPALQQVDA